MLHMATIGGAEALSLHESIGSFDAGKFADVVVLDPSAVALSQARDAISKEPLDRLFALTVLSDDRHVRATYIAGSERKG
jgi:guanine deaminase